MQEEVEPFPEEKDNFLQQLYKFMEDRGEQYYFSIISTLLQYLFV